MQKALALYSAARLQAALVELKEQLRTHASDTKLRTFFFELLCFNGEFDKAERQLDVLVAQDGSFEPGAALYRGLVRTHRSREKAFASEWSREPLGYGIGLLRINNVEFKACADEDDRIGPGLEMYAGGRFEIVPWTRISEVEIAKPVILRNLLWIPAKVLFNDKESTGEVELVYLPALAPLSWKHGDDAVRLGRTSVMEEMPDGSAFPCGAKMLLCDGELIPLLDVRSIVIER